MGSIEYVLSVADRSSSPLRRIAGASENTVKTFLRLTRQSQAVQTATRDFGGSLSTLRQKLALLQDEKEILDPNDLGQIRKYNREIDKLTKQIDRLDNTGRRGDGLRQFFDGLGLGGLIQPAKLAGKGVSWAVKNAMSFDERMARVNITAQLDKESLKKATEQVKAIAAKNKTDVVKAPLVLEQIISQTGDLDLSMSILDATLKGAKAQFASTDVVAGALARTLSIVGKENTNAEEVLDTFVAAKRVGAGEFSDFAQYIPDLIAGAALLGIGYKEVAGIFAYMTDQGQSAEQAATLMENLFSVLGRGDVVKKLDQIGIRVFDGTGSIRSTLDIFKEFQRVTGAMSGEQKSNFIESLGIVDKEAQNAFMVMASDTHKLADSLHEVADSAGATDRALELSRNSMQQAQELWASFNGYVTDLGLAILPIVNAGIAVAGPLLEIVAGTLTAVFEACSWWIDALREGNPVIWGLTAAGTAAGVMLTAHKLKLMKATTWTKIFTVTTRTLRKAMKLLRTAFLTTPFGWVALAVGLAAGAIAGLCSKTDKVTASFAKFNTELSKSKDGARASFEAAMKAKEGSEERAEAIRKINEQYGSYQKALLTETASNDELRDALEQVNGELERKIRNKFRDQAMGGAAETLEKARTDTLTFLLSRVPDAQKEAFVADFNKLYDQTLSSNKYSFSACEALAKKYDLERTWQILSPTMELWGLLGDIMTYKNTQSRINLLYGKPLPGTGNGDGNSTSETGATVPPGMNQTQLNELLRRFGGGGGGNSTSNVFDLDSVAVNEKGTGTYSTIVSKLNRVKVAGLTAAASLGIGLASPPLTQATALPDSAAVEMPALPGADNKDYDTPDRLPEVRKICDQLVINIQQPDGKGEAEIRQKIVDVLMEVVDGRA